MTLHILPDLEQGTDAWHDQRRGLITASAVGRLITPKTVKVADNDESRGLTMQLAAERITGWTDPTYVNDDMWRGIESEPIARDKYAEERGVDVAQVGFMVREFDGGHRLGYSPDGLVGDDGLIEIKAPRAKTHIRTFITDEVPLYNVAQLQAGLLVSGREWIDFISFCGGLPMYVKRVFPDPRWQEAIRGAVEKFETSVAQIVADYTNRTSGMPSTERLPSTSDIEVSF